MNERPDTETGEGQSYNVSPEQGIALLCPECGAIVEVADPPALIRAMHLMNECGVRTLLAPGT